ncbi:MAG: SagB/ThcOx family dehydrogenase [Planctomycetota bacterium]
MNRRSVSLAEYFHEETKYSESSIASLPPVDFSLQPEPFKDYHSERPIDLVPSLPFQGFPLSPQGGPTPIAADTLGEMVARLSRILYFTNGPTGIVNEPGGIHIFRSAPSAGALYPTEIYLVTRGIPGVEDGLYNYSVRFHRLVSVFDGALMEEIDEACWGHPALTATSAAVILTGVFGRSSWRYHDRAYRRILLDTGHVLGNLCLSAEVEGHRAVPIATFADEPLHRLLFFDATQEGVLVVAPLLSAEEVERSGGESVPLRRSLRSQRPVEGEKNLLLACHLGSFAALDAPVVREDPRPGDPWSEGETIVLEGTLSSLGSQFWNTVLRRRSTRSLAGGDIDREDLARILDFGNQPSLPGSVRYLNTQGLLETYLLITQVDGLPAGIYRYHQDEHELEVIRYGTFREQTHHFCLGQELAARASAVVIHTADLARGVEIFGDRAYRYLHLDAGFIGQYLNLAAVHLGVGVSGIGGFFDDEINSLLGIPREHAVVYVTVLGNPARSDPFGSTS